MTLNSLNQNAEKLFSSFLSLTASLSSLVGYEKGKKRGKSEKESPKEGERSWWGRITISKLLSRPGQVM